MEVIIQSVSKQLKGRLILNQVNLKLQSGSIYGLKGPNGSGKTMFMRLIAGLVRPDIGKVLIDGRKLGKDMDFPDSLGLLIENPAFLPNLTGLKNLELLAQIKGRTSITDIKKAIQRVGLNPDDKRTFRKFSLGMKQRLGIAAAIMESPEIILMDEPMNALDESGVQQICQIILQERKRGALIVLSCHDTQILEALSDEILQVSEGSIKPNSTEYLN